MRYTLYGNHLARSRYLSLPAALWASHRHGPLDRRQSRLSEGIQDTARRYHLHLARPLRPHTRRRAAGHALLARGGGDLRNRLLAGVQGRQEHPRHEQGRIAESGRGHRDDDARHSQLRHPRRRQDRVRRRGGGVRPALRRQSRALLRGRYQRLLRHGVDRAALPPGAGVPAHRRPLHHGPARGASRLPPATSEEGDPHALRHVSTAHRPARRPPRAHPRPGDRRLAARTRQAGGVVAGRRNVHDYTNSYSPSIIPIGRLARNDVQSLKIGLVALSISPKRGALWREFYLPAWKPPSPTNSAGYCVNWDKTCTPQRRVVTLPSLKTWN